MTPYPTFLSVLLLRLGLASRSALQQYVSLKHEGDKVLVFERGDLLFALNFHHSKSFEHYRIPAPRRGKYKIALDSDQVNYGGTVSPQSSDPNSRLS